MYTIVGATGNTGRVIVESLLAQGAKVRAIGRDAERLQPFARKGAETFVANLDDAAALARAFSGATAVYTMVPPDYGSTNLREHQRRIGETLATALEQAKVPFVVNLSSLGAQHAEGVGPVCGLHDVEQRLNRLPQCAVLHLRPGYFMENFYWNRDLITTQGINGTPVEPHLPVHMIATKDIGAVAVERLQRRDFSGKTVQELLGQRDLTMTEATTILGKALGKPELTYVQFPYEAAGQAMLGMGLSADVVKNLLELYQGLNAGRLNATETRSARNTTPTTFESFAAEFAESFAGAGQGHASS